MITHIATELLNHNEGGDWHENTLGLSHEAPIGIENLSVAGRGRVAATGPSQAEVKGGGILIPIGSPFDCEFKNTSGVTKLLFDPSKPIPKQTLELAEGIKRALCAVHSELDRSGNYHIKEEIVQLPGTNQASRAVSLVQVAGERLPQSVVNGAINRFLSECVLPNDTEQQTTRSVLQEVPIQDLEAMVGEPSANDLCGFSAEIGSARDPLAVQVLDEALVHAVASSATEFKRANRGKHASISVVTAGGTLTCRGEVPMPESRSPPSDSISVVRQIDGLGISTYRVSFVAPADDLSCGPTDPIAAAWIPEKFDAAIGQGDDKAAPQMPLLRKVREVIGKGSLLVKAEVLVSEVRGRTRYVLIGVEPV